MLKWGDGSNKDRYWCCQLNRSYPILLNIISKCHLSFHYLMNTPLSLSILMAIESPFYLQFSIIILIFLHIINIIIFLNLNYWFYIWLACYQRFKVQFNPWIIFPLSYSSKLLHLYSEFIKCCPFNITFIILYYYLNYKIDVLKYK